MASTDPQSPGSPHHRRKSIIGFFQNMNITDEKRFPDEKRKIGQAEQPNTDSPGKSLFSHASASPRTKHSHLRRTFRKGWPPTLRRMVLLEQDPSSMRPTSPVKPSRNMKMSDLYRFCGDNWAHTKAKDESVDVSADFSVATEIMDEVHQLCKSLDSSGDMVADEMVRSMAEIVYGSNNKARKGLGLDEALKMCMAIFNGKKEVEFSERFEEYQARLEAMIRKDLKSSDDHAIRNRREVVQHATAFQHIIDVFVRQDKPMNEELIKETQRILVRGTGGEGADFISTKEFGGVYGTTDVFAGSFQFPRPSTVAEAMRSMVKSMAEELEESETNSKLDPFALAAKYCDRLVNIHPFRDGNGRMCRLISNAVTIKYAGVVVSVGEHDQSRDG